MTTSSFRASCATFALVASLALASVAQAASITVSAWIPEPGSNGWRGSVVLTAHNTEGGWLQRPYLNDHETDEFISGSLLFTRDVSVGPVPADQGANFVVVGTNTISAWFAADDPIARHWVYATFEVPAPTGPKPVPDTSATAALAAALGLFAVVARRRQR